VKIAILEIVVLLAVIIYICLIPPAGIWIDVGGEHGTSGSWSTIAVDAIIDLVAGTDREVDGRHIQIRRGSIQ
jgi:hypothetical protein